MILVNIKKNYKQLIVDYVPIIITATLIIWLGIKNGQLFIKMLPCLVTLVVILLSSKVNRMTFIIGSINCITYSIGYYMEGLYGDVASALLYSMPFQFASFFMWKKHSYKQSVVVRRFSIKNEILIFGAVLIVAAVAGVVFNYLKSEKVVFQGINFAFGLAGAVLTVFGYLESCFLNFCVSASVFTMWIVIVLVEKNYANVTYLVINTYSMVLGIRAIHNWLKLYKEQKRGKTDKETKIEADEEINSEIDKEAVASK